MTAKELRVLLGGWSDDRNIEIDAGGQGFSPDRLEWDADRRCITVVTTKAPDIQEPYMYADEEVCPTCGNIKDVDYDCSICDDD